MIFRGVVLKFFYYQKSRLTLSIQVSAQLSEIAFHFPAFNFVLVPYFCSVTKRRGPEASDLCHTYLHVALVAKYTAMQ